MNRLWATPGGQGLVTTPSDFGLRATPPSHPQLLDYLASRLWDAEGSTKQILRDLVLSSTYQQSSNSRAKRRADSASREIDPDNRWLWHAPMKRLTFEQQRDTWLVVAQALDNAQGGRARSMFDNEDNVRRSVYGQVDRQFLPGVLRVFDFANPDLHTPVRSETIVPQQALFELNHPFAARSARRVAESVLRMTDSAVRPLENREQVDRIRIRRMFEQVLARSPRTDELESALAFLNQPPSIVPQRRVEADAWQYGYAKLDEANGRIDGFKKLPHFSGHAWQGGPKWPDGKLGWVQLTATGGHAGNDLEHAAVRRWTAPVPGQFRVLSHFKHNTSQGDGVRAWLLLTSANIEGNSESGNANKANNSSSEKSSSNLRVLHQQVVHNSEVEFSSEVLNLNAGDTIDFVVDFHKNLNNDQFEWSPKIERIETVASDSQVSPADTSRSQQPTLWSAEADFAGARVEVLSVWEQLAQVLLVSNELIFIE